MIPLHTPRPQRQSLQREGLPFYECPEQDSANNNEDNISEVVAITLHETRASALEAMILVTFEGTAE